MAKGAHHTGTYQRRARLLRQAAYANPLTTCWRCGLTLDKHPPHKDGTPARWTAGHTRDSDPTAPLMPEASTCNYASGAAYGHALRAVKPSRRWI